MKIHAGRPDGGTYLGRFHPTGAAKDHLRDEAAQSRIKDRVSNKAPLPDGNDSS